MEISNNVGNFSEKKLGSCNFEITKPLNFKLNRRGSIGLLHPINKLKRRRYSLSPCLLQRSFRLNAALRKTSLGAGDGVSNSVTINHQYVSLNSSNITKLLSSYSDSEDTSFSSTAISATDPDSYSVTDESICNSSKFSSGSSNTFVELSSDDDDDDNSESEAENEEKGTSSHENLVPMFGGYQLVGDSQLLRFAQHILGLEREFTHTPSGSLGLCVSGQKISDLYQRTRDGFYEVGEQLILLIGTNDLLKGTSLSEMCRDLNVLLRLLFQSAKKIIILTLPPVPRLSYKEDHWTKMNAYNKYIHSLPEKFEGKLEIADVSQLFYNATTMKCHYSCFERWFHGGRRKDLIHINEHGFKMIRNFLLKNNL